MNIQCDNMPNYCLYSFSGQWCCNKPFIKKFTWSKWRQHAPVSLTILLQIKSKKVMPANISTTCKFVYDTLVFWIFVVGCSTTILNPNFKVKIQQSYYFCFFINVPLLTPRCQSNAKDKWYLADKIFPFLCHCLEINVPFLLFAGVGGYIFPPQWIDQRKN